jgi:predicted nucleic acid-binding protein
LRSRRDQYYAEADRLFRKALEQRILLVTTNLVVAEVHRLTLHRAGVQPAFKALDRMGASASVSIQFATAEDHAAALRWLEQVGSRPTTYTDAVSFAVMERTDCKQVLGFDDDFPAAGFSLWRG